MIGDKKVFVHLLLELLYRNSQNIQRATALLRGETQCNVKLLRAAVAVVLLFHGQQLTLVDALITNIGNDIVGDLYANAIRADDVQLTQLDARVLKGLQQLLAKLFS